MFLFKHKNVDFSICFWLTLFVTEAYHLDGSNESQPYATQPKKIKKLQVRGSRAGSGPWWRTIGYGDKFLNTVSFRWTREHKQAWRSELFATDLVKMEEIQRLEEGGGDRRI